MIFRSSFPASNSTIGPPHASSPFSLQTGRANVLSKQLKFQKFQERCVQHDAFQRTTRNIKHRTTSYIGTLKTRDFWSKRAQIESKNHDNVVNIVLYWTFLGLSAPYEVVERSCAIFCILIYFTRYKTNKCVGNFFDGTNFAKSELPTLGIAEKHHFKHLLLYSYTR